jgi:hypothetical protein
MTRTDDAAFAAHLSILSAIAAIHAHRAAAQTSGIGI